MNFVDPLQKKKFENFENLMQVLQIDCFKRLKILLIRQWKITMKSVNWSLVNTNVDKSKISQKENKMNFVKRLQKK